MAADVPVLAIGGISEDRVGEIAATGIAGIAAIGLFLDAADASGAEIAWDAAAVKAEVVRRYAERSSFYTAWKAGIQSNSATFVWLPLRSNMNSFIAVSAGVPTASRTVINSFCTKAFR